MLPTILPTKLPTILPTILHTLTLAPLPPPTPTPTPTHPTPQPQVSDASGNSNESMDSAAQHALTATELRYQLNRLNANLEERRAELRAHRAQILGQIDNIMAHISDKSHPIHTAPLHSIRPIAPSGALRALSRVAPNGCPEIGLPCVAVVADAENEAPPAPRPLVSVSSALPK